MGKKNEKGTLQHRLACVANEYLARMAVILDRDIRDCYWVGYDEKTGRGVFELADFGDTIFLGFDEIQHIVNNIDMLERKWGSREEVAKQVTDWCDWVYHKGNIKNGHPRINMRSWMMGLHELKTKK